MELKGNKKPISQNHLKGLEGKEFIENQGPVYDITSYTAVLHSQSPKYSLLYVH